MVISRENQSLFADEAIYSRESGVVQLTGNVRFESDGDFLTGESGVFNLNSETGKINKGHIFISKNHFHISGDSMEKLEGDSYLVKNCRITTCDGEKSDWSITGSEVKVTIEGYGKVKNAAFRVRETPVLWLPYMVFPAKTERQTGFLPPGFGYSDRNGSEIEIPFFWAMSRGADMTFYERIMSQRGIMQGLEYRYESENAAEGIFMLDILSDNIKTKDMDNPYHAEISPFERTNETRYWFRGKADHDLPFGITARLDADFVSDQDYLHEFQDGLFRFSSRPDLEDESGRPLEETSSPTRRSALRIGYDDQDYSFQVATSYYQRPENPAYDDTPQPLAGLDFSFLPTAWTGAPVFLSLDTDYDYIWRDFGQKGHRVSFSPEVSCPVWIGRYFEFEPSVGFTRNSQWLEDNQEKDLQSRDAYHFQARLTTAMERIFNLKWRDVTRIKHKFSPSLTYRYHVPEDEEKPGPWFEAINAENKANMVTLSLDNYIDSRQEDQKGSVSYHQFAGFRISQGYDIDEKDRDETPWIKKKPFGPLTGILSISPFSDLDIDTEVRWDHYDKELSATEFSLDLTVERSNERKDRYSLDYENFKEGDKNLGCTVNINLCHGYSAGASLTRDMNMDYNLRQSLWIEYLSQCWGVRLTAGELDDASSVMLTFRLTGMGDTNK